MYQTDNGAQFQVTTRAIKWIALISMLCDHIAKVLLRGLINHHWTDASVILMYHSDGMLALFRGLQYFGRLAFPLFVFLLVEGFYLTRNRWKYLARIFIFALISEIPFDMAGNMDKLYPTTNRLVEFGYQNVMFTLAIGLLAMIVINLLMTKFGNVFSAAVLPALVAVGAIWLGNTLETDYHGYGVAAIMIAFWIRYYKNLKVRSEKQMTGWRMLEMGLLIVPLILQSTSEVWALIDVILIAFYFGKRGKHFNKWFFYIFYPAHLACLVILRSVLTSPLFS